MRCRWLRLLRVMGVVHVGPCADDDTTYHRRQGTVGCRPAAETASFASGNAGTATHFLDRCTPRWWSGIDRRRWRRAHRKRPIAPLVEAIATRSASMLSPGGLPAGTIRGRAALMRSAILIDRRYLWHWPLISFARIAQFGDASLVRDLAMAAMSWPRSRHLPVCRAASLGLAATSFAAVERPRDRAFGHRCVLSLGLRGRCRRWTGILEHDAGSGTDGQSAELAAAAECPAVICGLAANQHGSLIGDSHADRLGGPVFREAQRLGIAIDRNAVSADSDFAIVVRRWGLFFEDLLGADALCRLHLSRPANALIRADRPGRAGAIAGRLADGDSRERARSQAASRSSPTIGCCRRLHGTQSQSPAC